MAASMKVLGPLVNSVVSASIAIITESRGRERGLRASVKSGLIDDEILTQIVI